MGRLPIALSRGPCGREGPWPWEARARPGSAGGRYVGWGSVDQRRLPDEAGELARAGDGGDVGGLAALGGELVPLAVEAPLGTPRDRAAARVLALLAGAQLRGDPRPAPGVFGRLDQQPARVLGTGLGDLALAALLVGAALGGHEAEEGAELAGGRNRSKSPISAQSPTAARVSMPRKQRRRAIVCAHGLLGASCSSVASTVSRRWQIASTA